MCTADAWQKLSITPGGGHRPSNAEDRDPYLVSSLLPVSPLLPMQPGRIWIAAHSCGHIRIELQVGFPIPIIWQTLGHWPRGGLRQTAVQAQGFSGTCLGLAKLTLGQVCPQLGHAKATLGQICPCLCLGQAKISLG